MPPVAVAVLPGALLPLAVDRRRALPSSCRLVVPPVAVVIPLVALLPLAVAVLLPVAVVLLDLQVV